MSNTVKILNFFFKELKNCSSGLVDKKQAERRKEVNKHGGSFKPIKVFKIQQKFNKDILLSNFNSGMFEIFLEKNISSMANQLLCCICQSKVMFLFLALRDFSDKFVRFNQILVDYTIIDFNFIKIHVIFSIFIHC